jgi:hypothetical protein
VTRASEFCYIAETADGRVLQGLWIDGVPRVKWAATPEDALRVSEAGKGFIGAALPGIGFRKVLAG